MVTVGLLLYSVRCAGYSFIPSAEYAIIFEVDTRIRSTLLSFTFKVCTIRICYKVLKPWCTTLTLIASFSFVKSASPVATVATVEGVFGALYFGVGRGLGGLLGGLAVKGVGAKVAFRWVS